MGRASQDAEAHLVEIFASPQGEGPWVGVPTIFVRFGGCDLRCAWCDSPNTWLRGETCRIEQAPGSERFETRSNPVPVAAVVVTYLDRDELANCGDEDRHPELLQPVRRSRLEHSRRGVVPGEAQLAVGVDAGAEGVHPRQVLRLHQHNAQPAQLESWQCPS